jgi:ribose transport system permease protein
VSAAAAGRAGGRGRLGTTAIVWLALLVLVLVSAALLAAQGRNLFGTATVVDMLTRSSLLGFVAIGQTFVILSRSLDLSVGYVVALSSLVSATVMAGDPGRVPLGVGAALLVSAGVGLVNGLVITKLGVNPFIATLGVGLILKAYLDTRYQGPAGDVPASFQGFGYTRIGPIPVSTAVMVLLAVAGIVLLTRTRLGYHLFAVGGNDEVARFSGIRTDRTLISAHVLSALCAGVAGLLIAARFGTGSALVYDDGYDLDSIAAVVLGGTLLMGGRGSLAGTLGGVFILSVLDSVFNVLGVDPFFKDVLRGVVIVVAVAIYARRQIDPTRRRPRFAPGGGPLPAPVAADPPDPPPGADPGGTAPVPPTSSAGAAR